MRFIFCLLLLFTVLHPTFALEMLTHFIPGAMHLKLLMRVKYIISIIFVCYRINVLNYIQLSFEKGLKLSLINVYNFIDSQGEKKYIYIVVEFIIWHWVNMPIIMLCNDYRAP